MSESWTAQEQQVSQKVEETLAGEKVDAVLCVAGGWAGGNAASKGTHQRCLQFQSPYSHLPFKMYLNLNLISAKHSLSLRLINVVNRKTILLLI